MLSEKILVAYDGSPGSKKALNWALEAGSKFHIKVVIAAVIAPAFEQKIDFDADVCTNSQLIQKKELEKILGEAEDLFKQKGIAVKSVIRYGIPADELIECAQEENVDLICTGTRGYSASKTLMLGSVAHKLTIYSPISVLVIK